MRLLALLNDVDLTVSDLISILGQSQPRLSRHLKLLVEAGLTVRFQEGAWAYFRNVDRGPARDFLQSILSSLDEDDPVWAVDQEKLAAVRERRARRAADYFAANAQSWNTLRSLHVAESEVEQAMLKLGLSHQPQTMLDLGTGTGRILELFAPHLTRGLGLDTSHDMLAVARTATATAGLGQMKVRHGDVYRLEDVGQYDLVVLHQVLHFLDDPALALRQAVRTMADEGRLLVVDFAPHDFAFLREEHAHRWPGLSKEQLGQWAKAEGLEIVNCEELTPPPAQDTMLTVMVWLLRKSGA